MFEQKPEQEITFFKASETCNNETHVGDNTQMLEETKEGMCNSHIKEGSLVVSNLLRQLSVTDRLTHCWSHGLWETERLAFFLSPKSRLPFP